MSDKERLIELFYELETIEYGNFILRSGKESRYKIFADRVLLHPEGSSLCGKLGLEAVTKIELNDGMEYGIAGIISGGAMFAQSIGNEGNRSRILLEDVGTTAGSIIDTTEFMKEKNIEYCGYTIVIVDREEGARENLQEKNMKLVSILTKKDLGIEIDQKLQIF